MVPAMILAAGLGTRLRPLTDRCAKSLVPVGDRPMLSHVLERLRAGGVLRVVVNAHHRVQDLLSFVAGQRDVAVSGEAELLGTAGGVARAAALLGGGSVLVWNADILADVDVRALVEEHDGAAGGASPTEATLVVRPLEKGQGSVGLDAAGRIVRLRRERVGDEVCGGEFLGIHVLGQRLRKALPSRGCLVGDVYIPAMRGGARLGTLRHHGSFFDIGTPRGYIEANVGWLGAQGAPHWTGVGARVGAGVVLERAVVGAGAQVLGTGLIRQSVVWPGAVATAPLMDAVVTGLS